MRRGIEIIVHCDQDKCAVAKRFIRTLKAKLYRWITRNNTCLYLYLLDKVVSGNDIAEHWDGPILRDRL